MNDIEFERRTVEEEYVLLNGKSFPLTQFLDFVDEISRADARCNFRGVKKDIAESLKEEGLLDHTRMYGYKVTETDEATAEFNQLKSELYAQWKSTN